ncbi:nodulation protein l [Ophiostoma piceae UAMH 11346]|uniref:Nodulation protein l n=1 Tax=Ophiostoma piceae (strain UAMH 11346) TaxID=1262450 RepID=S3C940_OPHP1|nr:nodulation protein l [Ophiostoma piceae UAMH 11346]
MSPSTDQRVEQWMKMPGFTSLNGAGSPRSPADDTIEVRLPPTSHDEPEYTGTSPQTVEPRTMPDITAASRRERDIWGTSTMDRPAYRSPAMSYPNLENPAEASQKRKRSYSIEESAPQPQDAARSHSQHHQHHQHQRSTGSDLPRLLTATETAAAAIAAASAASRDGERPHISVETRDPYDLSRNNDYSTRPPYSDDRADQMQQQRQKEQREREQHQREQNRKELWYSHPSQEDRHPSVPYDTAPSSTAAYHQRSGSIQSPVEEHSGNDSQHRSKSVARASASPQSEYAGRTPDEEDRHAGYSATPFSPSQQRKAGSAQQSDPKRRKRNFSNRTKTGCLTCRKRKKKCDETKPECSNCVRGGFICAGSRRKRIESKDPNYVPPGAYGMPGPHSTSQAAAPLQPPQRRESMPTYRGPSLRIEPPQGRPITTDDDRPTASTLPSALTSAADSHKLSALSAFSAPANAFPTPISAATSVSFLRTPKDYQRVPPLLELARNAEPETPQHTHLPKINFHRAGSPHRMEQSPQQMQLPLPTQSTQPQQQQQQQGQPPHSQTPQLQPQFQPPPPPPPQSPQQELLTAPP